MKRKKTQDTWEDVEAAYNKACCLSCKPDESFRKVRTGDIIDEERSVRWNREEVERLKQAYDEEVKRLNRVKNSAVQDAIKRVVRLIADEADISEEKAEILWSFVYREHHEYDMFQYFDRYIDLVKQIRE